MQALTKAIKDIYRPVHVRGKMVPTLNRLRGGIFTAEQQGSMTIGDNKDCDARGRFSFPNGGTYLDLPATKEIPTQEKRKKNDTWKRPCLDHAIAVAVAVSKIWTTTRYRERVSFDRYPTVSQG
jgi:cell division FtsZ-interacting protein ZapD